MTTRDEVAVVGFAARVPGATNATAFWSILRDNRCTVSAITPDRFATEAFYHPWPDQIGRSYTFSAGVIDDVWGFDAIAFGMSPREAEQVDPQHRHLLEVAHDALAHAGIRPSSLGGTPTGVYIGGSSVDHAARFFADPSIADVHMMTGNSLSIMANRVSYGLDLRGPSIAIDTACSSSLVALNLAAEAIRSGQIETAVVGGVNLLLSPFSFVGFSRASMLSPTGLCRPFDAAADGYVRSEGAIVVVLRSMAASRQARNRIHAVIVGSGINQDGRTTGLSLPSAESQRQLLDRVYDEFAVDPADLAFVEAHGTGTPVGDPIEADALGKGLAQRRAQALPIGSVKSNIGHLEPVSGLAGLLKSVLALEHGLVPATLHQQSPNPNIPLDELNLRVVNRNWRLPERRAPLLAGVNSFGFGGTNAHVILRSDRSTATLVQIPSAVQPPPLLLSAHSAEALPRLASAYVRQWPTEARHAHAYIGAAAHQRDALPHRVVVRGHTADEIKHHLIQFAQGAPAPSILSGRALGSDLPVTFLFSGNGSQWAGMGRTAWASSARFQEALRDVDRHFAKVQPWSIVDMLFDEDLPSKLRHAPYSQPLLLALQIATVQSLEQNGVTAAAALGHSVGEIAAAWCAGALSVEQAIDVVIARSRHQEGLHGSGAMAALMLSEQEGRRFLETTNAQALEIAAINSWRSVTVSGRAEEIDRLVATAGKLKISARRLDLDYPFHSALVDPVRAPLLRELEGLKPLKLRKRFVSSVTGRFEQHETLGAQHWWLNVREPVRFAAALDCLLKEGMRLFLEIGPRPILTSYVRDCLREAGSLGAIIETLSDADTPEHADPVERATARLVVAGGHVETQRFFGTPPSMPVDLPLYPWQHRPFQVMPSRDSSTVLIATAHPLLGKRPRADSSEWFSTIDAALYPWILEHKVGAIPVLPATAYVEILMAAARETLGDGALELRDVDVVRPMIFDQDSSYQTHVRVAPETGIIEFLSRPYATSADWTLHARGTATRPTAIEGTPLPSRGRGGEIVVPKARIYATARELGLDYGPTFQRAQHVSFPQPKLATARLDAPPELIEGTRLIDVTAMDAAFHALFASEDAGVADMPMKRMLPVRFGSVRIYHPAIVASRLTARTVRQSLSSMVVDIQLWDTQDRLVAEARDVRLIETPAELSVDPRSLSYRMIARTLDRAGASSVLRIDDAGEDESDVQSIAEAFLLLEAGALRAAWSGFSEAAGKASGADDDAEHVDWLEFLRTTLSWRLETRNLVARRDDGTRSVARECDLPTLPAIVNSLMVRHPTTSLEVAGLSRLPEIVRRLVDGDRTVAAELQASHWQQIDIAARQVGLLRDAVVKRLVVSVERADRARQLRLIMVGAEHIDVAADLRARFDNVELLVLDADADRLERARATLGGDTARLRCMQWAQSDELTPASFDLAFAIDALSEVAATRDGLDRLRRLLRADAPLLAGELAPSVFWDIARGVRPGWWQRSVSADFPVGALLSAEEWVDDLETAGFANVTARPLGTTPIGVIAHGVARQDGDSGAGRAPESPVRWERVPPAATAAPAAGEPVSTRDIGWLIRADEHGDDPSRLGDLLHQIGNRCRALAEEPARLWIAVDFGETDAAAMPLERPLWCALTAALRVVSNEYSGLPIHCLGFAGLTHGQIMRHVADEAQSAAEERELFFTPDRRVVLRIERGVAANEPAGASAERPALRLASRHDSGRGAFAWEATDRRRPGDHEVEIEVAATGLNFRDVMWNLRLLPEEALEDGYAGTTLGMECAGIVTSVGDTVSGLAVGDRVVAFAPGAFASHVVAPAFAVGRLPEGISFEAAATLPVAFLTAWYSLVHCARLGRDETVLIHGGAGGVGLAALQIAKHLGARVVATAGSEEKRALLRSLGADLVCSSRTLGFVDAIANYTGGQGVDVVLNSLAREAMVRSVDCLKPFGRFVELGKRDFYGNTHLGLRPFRRNLSYFGVDVDQLIGRHAGPAQELFAEIVRLVGQGDLVPLPHRVFPGAHVADAFRLMQRSAHIGKVVVTPASQASGAAPAERTFPVSAEGLHVVIGGTSGFGLATAAWLAERGARHLALVSRSGRLADAAMAQVDALRAGGVVVQVASVDVTDGDALEGFLRAAAARRPIKGIAHAAMVLDDRLVAGVDRASIGSVLDPKVAGALHLERLAPGLDLDYLLLFSSATTLFGNPGQYSYVAANAFVEGVARRMHARGLPALAVAWGAIEDAGYLSRNIESDANLKRRFATSLLPAKTALNGLDWVFGQDGRQRTTVCAIARIDWSMATRELAATRAPTFDAVRGTVDARGGAGSAALIESLRAKSPEDALEAMLEIVVEEIARVLRLPPKDVDRYRPLADIGMDSLMMLELRTTVETSLQIELPMMTLANGLTPADVARKILPLITGGERGAAVPGAMAALSASHFAAEAEAVDPADREMVADAVLEEVKRLEGPL